MAGPAENALKRILNAIKEGIGTVRAPPGGGFLFFKYPLHNGAAFLLSKIFPKYLQKVLTRGIPPLYNRVIIIQIWR